MRRVVYILLGLISASAFSRFCESSHAFAELLLALRHLRSIGQVSSQIGERSGVVPLSQSLCYAMGLHRSDLTSCGAVMSAGVKAEIKRESIKGMKVTALFRYPLKSGRTEALSKAEITQEGFQGDRRFMVAMADGTGLTQREVPKLATIELYLSDDRENIHLSAPNIDTFIAPLLTSERYFNVNLFGTSSILIDQGLEVTEWLGKVLGENELSFHLLYAPEPIVGRPSGLSDVAPLHLLCEESFDHLNSRRADLGLPPVLLDRFRPNIVISGCPQPDLEADAFAFLRIFETAFRVEPCVRCQVPDVNQQVGKSDKLGSGPMKTLGSYRKRGSGITFGAYLYPVQDTLASVSIGDEVEAILTASVQSSPRATSVGR